MTIRKLRERWEVMTTEDALLARDAAVQELRGLLERIERAGGAGHLRRVAGGVRELREARQVARAKHTQYLAKARKPADDPAEASVNQFILDEAAERIEALEDRLRELEDARHVDDAISVLNSKCRLVCANLRSMKEGLGSNPSQGAITIQRDLTSFQEQLDQAAGDAQKVASDAEPGVARDRLITAITERVPQVAAEIRTVWILLESMGGEAPSTPRTMGGRSRLGQRALPPLPREVLARSSSAVGSAGADSIAPDGGERGRDPSIPRERASTVSGSNPAARIRKLELPRFAGEARAYNSFKRDFCKVAELVEIVDAWEIGHRLKYECLSGHPRSLCANLADPEAMWRRLDEEYADPMRAVDEINDTLTRMRRIGEDEFSRYIKFVDYLESAEVDLAAAAQSSALSNAHTCHTVLSRCPRWVRGPVVAESLSAMVPPGDFPWLLSSLVRRRAEARRQLSLEIGPGRAPARLPPAGPAAGRSLACAGSVEEELLGGPVLGLGGGAPTPEMPPPPSRVGGGRRRAGGPERACAMAACRQQSQHFLSRCPEWMAADAAARAAVVRSARLCRLCLDRGHQAVDCPRRQSWAPCDVDGCGEWHHRSLHGIEWGHPGRSAAVLVMGSGLSRELLVQDVDTPGGGSCRVVWDSGSGMTLVTEEYAARGGLDGPPVRARMVTIGGQVTERDTRLFSVPLQDRDGRNIEVKAYGVPEIAGPITGRQMLSPGDELVGSSGETERPADVLISLAEAPYHPRFMEQRDGWSIFRSQFGTGYLAVGGDSTGAPRGSVRPNERTGGHCLAGVVPHTITTDPAFCHKDLCGTEAGLDKQPGRAWNPTVGVADRAWWGLHDGDILPTSIQVGEPPMLGKGQMVQRGIRLLLPARGISVAGGVVCHVAAGERPTVDFLTAEGLGVDLPRRCVTCDGCKECRFRAAHLTWREAEELRAIERGLVLDTQRRQWTARYPYRVPPETLADNRAQAITLMYSLERRLRRTGRLEDFNKVFQDSVDRGVFREITDPYEHRGPVNYISLVEAFKEGPLATTPLRICLNSSLSFRGRSLNGILMKGPSALTELFGVAVRFREPAVAVVRDLKKFYQSVNAVPEDQHLRRVVWRFGEDGAPRTFISMTVNFGDRPAGAIAQTALRQTALMNQDLHPPAAEAIRRSTYVDDTVGGGRDLPEARELSNGLDLVAGSGGFLYGEPVFSGDPQPPGVTRKVLGIVWESEQDLLAVAVRVNLGGRVKGASCEPDIPLSELPDALPPCITRRQVWRVALGQFDLLGLVAPFLLRLKLQMRALSATGDGRRAVSWDEAVSEVARTSFAAVMGLMEALSKLRFLRCIRPLGAAPDFVFLVTFVDGASLASCAITYAAWPVGSGLQCRLVAAKTRVAPLHRMTIPRMELQAAVIGVRLASKIQEHLAVEVRRRWFFTDSSCVLGMLMGDMSTFKEFVATRVAEIRSRTQPETEWRWIPSEANIADLGTRGMASPSDLDVGTEYQLAPAWLALPENEWPAKRQLGPIPRDEILATALICPSGSKRLQSSVIEASHFSTFGRLVRVAGMALEAVDCFRNWRRAPGSGNTSAAGDSGKTVASLALRVSRRRVEVVRRLAWLEKPASEWDTRELRALGPVVQVDAGGRHVMMVGGRRGELTALHGDLGLVPVVDGRSELGRLAVRTAHEENHAGVARTVLASRREIWVTRAAAVARTVVAACLWCRKERARPIGQIMAPLPAVRTTPAAPFSAIAVDLFGPVPVLDAVKRRVVRDGYGFIAVCLASTAIYADLCGDYSSGAVGMVLRRLFAVRGVPHTIYADPGTQFEAAAKGVRLWEVVSADARPSCRTIEWRTIPAASQHVNGLAERMVGVLKKALRVAVPAAGGARLTREEWDTVLAEAVAAVNSRPLAVAGAAEEAFHAITPNHLLLGRASAEVISGWGRGEDAPLTRRLEFVRTIADMFWAKWIAHVAPVMRLQNKWFREEREVRPGDVVLLLYDSKISKRYRLGRVEEIELGSARDGRKRTIIVRYVGTDGVHRRVRRSVHTVVLLLPVEEQ